MGVDYNSKIVTNGLVLCLDAANPRSYSGSGSTWQNVTGNTNYGATIYGSAPYTNGTTGYFNLDGVSQYFITPNLTNTTFGNWPISCELVFYTNTVVNNDLVNLVGIRSISDSNTPILLSIEARNSWAGNYSGAYGIIAMSNYPRYVVSPPGSIVNNTWYHIVQTSSASDTKLYINGVLISTSSSNQTFYTGTTSSFGIGCAGMTSGSVEYPTYTSNQRISICRFYNIELSVTQILQNFRAIRGRYGI